MQVLHEPALQQRHALPAGLRLRVRGDLGSAALDLVLARGEGLVRRLDLPRVADRLA